MKTVLLTMLLWATTLGAFGQGTLNVGNFISGVFRAPIYGPQLESPITSLSGQSPLGIPAGTTVYTGPLLQGTGYTFAVYYGAATVQDPFSLTLLVSTTFRTGGAAGLVTSMPGVVVPGVAPGQRAMMQVRAWNNESGRVTTYADAYSRNASAMFLSEPLGGGVFLPVDMTGWTSFNIYPPLIPEPSPLLLAGLGVFGVFRWRRKVAQASR